MVKSNFKLARTCTQLVDQPPSWLVAVMYPCSAGVRAGRSR